MHNDNLDKLIEARKREMCETTEEDISRLRALVDDKEKALYEMEKALPLSEYSTTQLKAELRRRKRERQGAR